VDFISNNTKKVQDEVTELGWPTLPFLQSKAIRWAAVQARGVALGDDFHRLALRGFLVLSILFSPVGLVSAQPTEAPAAPGSVFELNGAGLQQAFAAGMNLYKGGNNLEAASVFARVVDSADPADALVQEASYLLGVALFNMDLHQSALVRFEPIIEASTGHPKYRQLLPYLLKIARSASAEPNVLEKIAQYDPSTYPPDFADELHFLVGRYHFSQDSLDEALKRFGQVSGKNGDLSVRARYLEGVIHVAQSGLDTDPATADPARLATAAKNFKDILRVQRDGKGTGVVNKVAAMANLALGRLFFSTRQYGVAVRYYDLIDDKNPDWLQAIFEVSWVYFQLRQYPRALGNLHTLTSPFFTDQYFPESRVLQSLILFYNCRYEDALAVVKEFVQDYYPLLKELGAQLNQFPDPNAFYLWLARLSQESESKFSERFKRIFNAALADRKLRRKFAFITVLNKELAAIKNLAVDSPSKKVFLTSLKGELLSYRTLVVGEAGSLAQARLTRVLKELKQHLAGALKIKGETLKAQRNALSSDVRREQAAAAAATFELVVDDEHVEWPFNGEYWKDELGSYIYDISSKCKTAPK
jgi:tetratricopeptide (TPR) repeat protein